MIKQMRLFVAGLILAGLACAFLPGHAAPQTAQSNIDKFVVKGSRNEISSDTAAKIGQAALDYAAAHNFHVTIYILGPEGNIVFARRMDGEHAVNGQTALKKAQTALWFRRPTHAL